MKKGFRVFLLIFVTLSVVFIGYFYIDFIANPSRNNQNITRNVIIAVTPSPRPTNTVFQNILTQNCVNQTDRRSQSGEILLSTLPLTVNLKDLKTDKGKCDSYFTKYVQVNLGNLESYLTFSDINSNFCCHSPSVIEPTGKLIKSEDNISLYLHTGEWSEGPNSDYKPIIVRGVKDFKLTNGEIIRVVLDRKALENTNPELKKIEDKYKVDDTYFSSGKKVLTPASIEKMFTETFFSSFNESSVLKEVETDIRNITFKN